jgi:chorismate synthase
MASNSFGTHFRITTWGESHGLAVGCVLDGCPPGIPISDDEINQVLLQRAPGRAFVSERKEEDRVEILSGLFDGMTTGAPILLLIKNKDHDSSKYEAMKALYRPGHANFTYLQKYGVFDHRGGGRASARETAARVAAGAIAKKFLKALGIEIVGYIQAIGTVTATSIDFTHRDKSPIFCPDIAAEASMLDLITKVKELGDSVGGVVACQVAGVMAGLGDPMYDKIQARLAYAMLSLPAAKGFEIGEGYHAACMHGSEHNDGFIQKEGKTQAATNHAGGVLGGITTGEPIFFTVAFKPTSSIFKTQKTVDFEGNEVDFSLPAGSRHDPCVAIRAVPVVEAMCALVLMDAVLHNQTLMPCK